MNVHKSSQRKALWDLPTIHPSREAAYAPIAPGLNRFKAHKKEILDRLRNGCACGTHAEPFDPERPWIRLTRFAEMYLWGRLAKQETTSPAERFNRLRQLARALDHTHDLAIRAMHEDIGWDIFGAWCADAKITVDDKAVFNNIASALNDIKKAIDGLASVRAAAFKAAASNAVPPKSGRPALLPSECYHGLAQVYRDSTGLKPGRGAGPFAGFVYEFIRAVHPPDFEFEYDSVVDGIKDAHLRHKPSKFDP